MPCCTFKASHILIVGVCSILLLVRADEDYGRASPFIVIKHGPFNITDYSRKRADSYAADLSPSNLKTVYNMDLSATAGAGKTIAIINAYAHPGAESDLSTFSTYYNLPLCTTANGCFKRVNQQGGTTYTTNANADWAHETSLDLQWAHAIAPGANILYVEANTDLLVDLMEAVHYASQNADYVSMSFGLAEAATHRQLESYFSSTTTSFFAAAGDNGAMANYPAASPNVIAVGGTTLFATTSGVLDTEDGWSMSGGGCSKYFSATSDQLKATSLCGTTRAIPDVAFNADPNSGVLIYVSEGCTSAPSCWYGVGGTSLSSPIMAGRAAVSGAIVKSSFVYGGEITFRDITAGSNGLPCGAGFDLVTGMGTWVNTASTTASTTASVAKTATTAAASTASVASSTISSSATSTTGRDLAHLGVTTNDGGYSTGSYSSSAMRNTPSSVILLVTFCLIAMIAVR